MNELLTLGLELKWLHCSLLHYPPRRVTPWHLWNPFRGQLSSIVQVVTNVKAVNSSENIFLSQSEQPVAVWKGQLVGSPHNLHSSYTQRGIMLHHWKIWHFPSCLMWHLFTARDILAFADAAVCGLLQHTVRFVLARFPRWQNRGDTAAACSFSHFWPLIRTACVCMHGLLACLFVCVLACLCPGDFREKSRDRKNGTAVKCVFRWFCPSSECPCIWFATEQSSMVHTKSLPPFGMISLRDAGGTPRQMHLLQPVSAVDTGSEIWTHQLTVYSCKQRYITAANTQSKLRFTAICSLVSCSWAIGTIGNVLQPEIQMQSFGFQFWSLVSRKSFHLFQAYTSSHPQPTRLPWGSQQTEWVALFGGMNTGVVRVVLCVRQWGDIVMKLDCGTWRESLHLICSWWAAARLPQRSSHSSLIGPLISVRSCVRISLFLSYAGWSCCMFYCQFL